MAIKPKKLTWQQHQGLGSEIQQMHARLHELTVMLSNTYGVSKKVGQLARKAGSSVDQLRSELDNLVHQDCPDIAQDALSHCYYGNYEDFHGEATIERNLQAGNEVLRQEGNALTQELADTKKARKQRSAPA